MNRRRSRPKFPYSRNNRGRVPVLGVTGGIATGKTTFTQLLRQRCPAAAPFDADACGRQLLTENAEVRAEVLAAFGDAVLSAGQINRRQLKEIIFREPARRLTLEQILHPRIRARWLSLAETHRGAAASGGWLLVDIPLLFETGGDAWCDRTVMVACTPATQRQRVQRHRDANPDLAERIIASQWPQEEKIRRADHVVWNDGPPTLLEPQADLLAGLLLDHAFSTDD